MLPRDERADVGGIGGTVAANVLSLAAMRATLGEVLTEAAFEHMIELGGRFEAGVQTRSNGTACRGMSPASAAVSSISSDPNARATEARPRPGGDAELDRLIHLYALNRGILLTPFHNMALMSPATTEADVDLHSAVFDEAAKELSERA